MTNKFPGKFCSWMVWFLILSTLGPVAPAQDEKAGRLPAEPIPLSAQTPQVPWAAHAPTDAGSIPQATRGETEVRSLVPAAAQPDSDSPWFHLQGDFVQRQGQDLSSDEFSPLWGRRNLASPIATPESGLEKRAGDSPQAPGAAVASFSAQTYTGWIPPDTVLAVGPNHIVEAVNSGFTVFDKAGALQSGYHTFASFYSPVVPAGWSGFLFDPRVRWSEAHQKYVMLVLGLDSSSQKSYFFLAVSQTADPQGIWWLWRFTANPDQDSDAWLDFASLGVDEWGVYVTGNYFYWVGGFKYSVLFSLNPAMLNGGSSSGWRFWDLRWPTSSSAFSLQAATPHSVAGGQETFFVNSFSSSGNQVLLWKLTGDRTSSPTLSKAAIGITAYDAIGGNVDQPGSATDLDGGDARVVNAVYSQRRVYGTLTTDPADNGSSSGILSFKLNVDSNTLEWDSLIWSGSGVYYFYPAITVDGGTSTDPNIGVFMSWTQPSATVYPSGAFYIYDQDGTDPFISTIFGAGAYVRNDSSGRNRWGDYNDAVYDWTCRNIWGAVEYATSSNTWGTQITGVTIGDELPCNPGIFSDGFESGNLARWSDTYP